MEPTRWLITSPRTLNDMDDVLATLLQNRHMDSAALNGSLKELEIHLAMKGMAAGAEIMSRHLQRSGKIVLIGDYDCDGITSVAQMSLFLKDIGYPGVTVMIPRRTEGYGFPLTASDLHPDASLFVAMDCGTLDQAAIAKARDRGADVIVIDHHEAPVDKLAPANAIINPKQIDCPSPYKDLCSSGLTLLFLARLRQCLPPSFPPPALGGKYLALAAIGTVADMVPLTGPNRILTRSGLSALNSGSWTPPKSLMQVAGFIPGRTITAGHLAYYLCPRLNAAGRMADPQWAYDLLMSDSPQDSLDHARRLQELNHQRRQTEERILATIRERLEHAAMSGRSLVMGDPSWPVGIVGIIAARLQQEVLYGPTIVFSMDEKEGIARGSARSIPGINIHDALQQCEDLLLKWGGHAQAAGMSLKLELMTKFAHRFEEVLQCYPQDRFIREKRIDALMDLALVSPELIERLSLLEPHGVGNPAPTFGARGVRIRDAVPFGRDGAHLRLQLAQGLKAVYWRGSSSCDASRMKESMDTDLVFQVEFDDYSKGPMLVLKDLGKLW